MREWLCGFFWSHRTRVERRRGVARTKYRSLAVADRIREERESCRCGKNCSPWNRVVVRHLKSLTLSETGWDRFYEDGVLYD